MIGSAAAVTLRRHRNLCPSALESLRTQLLERSDVTVSRVIYDDIEVSENVKPPSAQMLRRLFVSHVSAAVRI